MKRCRSNECCSIFIAFLIVDQHNIYVCMDSIDNTNLESRSNRHNEESLDQKQKQRQNDPKERGDEIFKKKKIKCHVTSRGCFAQTGKNDSHMCMIRSETRKTTTTTTTYRDDLDSDGIRDISDVMRRRVSCIIGSWMILVVNRKVYGI